MAYYKTVEDCNSGQILYYSIVNEHTIKILQTAATAISFKLTPAKRFFGDQETNNIRFIHIHNSSQKIHQTRQHGLEIMDGSSGWDSTANCMEKNEYISLAGCSVTIIPVPFDFSSYLLDCSASSWSLRHVFMAA